MSKKGFKGGLDSLLKSTLNKDDNPLAKTFNLGVSNKTIPTKKSSTKTKQSTQNKTEKEQKPQIEEITKKQNSDSENESLIIKIELLKQELKLWRTGELTQEKFHESLKKKGLKYNVEKNQIEKL